MDPLIVALRERALDPARATEHAFEFSDPAPPPLDELTVQRAEARLRRMLPPLLREIYRFVGNGGFGPGYGLLPLTHDDESEEFPSVVWLYENLSAETNEPGLVWPEMLLPFCDWGCAIQSCIDISSRDGAIFTFDPGALQLRHEMSDAFARTHGSLRAWLSDWLGGVKLWELMFEPDPERTHTGINPFTKEPITFVPNKLRRPANVEPPAMVALGELKLRRARGASRLKPLEFIARARRQPEVVVERTVSVPGPTLRALLDSGRSLPLTEVLSHPDQRRERRSFRYAHILGPGLSERELATWQERHPETRLSASMLALLREVDGIHLWADLDRGKSYFGILPLNQWLAVHEHGATSFYEELPRSALVVSYHENSDCFLILDAEKETFSWFDPESGSDSDVVAESVEEWLDWWWDLAQDLDPRNQAG